MRVTRNTPSSAPAEATGPGGGEAVAPRARGDKVGVRFDAVLLATQMAAEWKALASALPDDARAVRWVRRLAEPVARQAAARLPAGAEANVHVLAAGKPRVVALPSGDVFVTAGRIVEARDAGELRSNVAGELAHAALGHAERRFVEAAGPALLPGWISGDEPRAAEQTARRYAEGDALVGYTEAERAQAAALAGAWIFEAGPPAQDEAAEMEAVRRTLLGRATGGAPLRTPGTLPDGRTLAALVGALVGAVALLRACG